MESMLLLILIFLTMSVGGLAVVAAILLRLPANYFSESGGQRSWMKAHPVLRWPALLLKNTIGALIVAVGIVLSLPGVPGPGLLTILIGIMLMDFPGKRRLERALIRRPQILERVNRLRRRFGKPPFFDV
jgi:hypothetical protein